MRVDRGAALASPYSSVNERGLCVAGGVDMGTSVAVGIGIGVGANTTVGIPALT